MSRKYSSICYKVALAFLNAFIPCQLTLLFAFIAWLGATSIWWGLGLVALGVAADVASYFYQVDWRTGKLVRIDGEYLDVAELDRLIADAGELRKLKRFSLKTNIILYGIPFVVLLPIIIADYVLGDDFFTRHKTVIDVIDYVPRHLFYAVRRTTELLIQNGYEHRVAVVELFKSVCLSVIIIVTMMYSLFAKLAINIWTWIGIRRYGCNITEHINNNFKYISIKCTFIIIYMYIVYLCLYYLMSDLVGTVKFPQNYHVSNVPMILVMILSSCSLVFLFICKVALATAQEQCRLRLSISVDQPGEQNHV